MPVSNTHCTPSSDLIKEQNMTPKATKKISLVTCPKQVTDDTWD